MRQHVDTYEEVNTVLSDILADDRVQEMKNFIQHGRVSTYDHCKSVARVSYVLDRKLSLRSDLKTLLVGAMLHDFYLYDWHGEEGRAHPLHGFRHAETACCNAKQRFHIDEATGNVISCHMWPLNIRKLPPSREAWIVCIADKYVSLCETLFRR